MFTSEYIKNLTPVEFGLLDNVGIELDTNNKPYVCFSCKRNEGRISASIPLPEYLHKDEFWFEDVSCMRQLQEKVVQELIKDELWDE